MSLLQKKGLRAKVRAKARTSALVARTLENNTDWTTWSPDDLTYIASNNSSTLDTDKLNMSSVSLTAEDDYDNQFALRNAATGILSGIANGVVSVINGTVAMVAGEPATRPVEAMREINSASSGGEEPETPWDIPGGEETTREAVGGGIAGFVGDVTNLVAGAVSAIADPFVAPAPEGAPNFYADAASLVTRPIFAAADALDNALPDGYLGGPGPATRARMAVPQADDDSEIDGAASEPTEAEKNAKLAARVARTAQKAEAARQESEAAQKAFDTEMELLRKEIVNSRSGFDENAQARLDARPEVIAARKRIDAGTATIDDYSYGPDYDSLAINGRDLTTYTMRPAFIMHLYNARKRLGVPLSADETAYYKEALEIGQRRSGGVVSQTPFRAASDRPIGTDAQIREAAKTATTFGLGSRARGSWPEYVEELIAKKNAGTLSPGQRILLEDLERHRINKAIDKLRREDEARAAAAPSNPLKALADTVIGVADSIASTVAPKKWYEGYEPAATQTAVSSATTPTSQKKWYQGYNAADYQPAPSGKWSSAPRTSARIAQAKAMQDAHYAGKPEARAKDASRKAKQTQSLARYKGNVAKLDFRGTGNNL